MKWICEKCGLEVDDKHVPNNCGGVKDQPHVWEETWWHNKKLEALHWQSWLESEDSLDWKNEYTRIKTFFSESAGDIQRNFVSELETGKEKFEKLFEQKEKERNEAREKQIKKELNKKVRFIFWIFIALAVTGFLLIAFLLKHVEIGIIYAVFVCIAGIILRHHKLTLEQKALKSKYEDENRKRTFKELIELFCNEPDEDNLPGKWKDFLKETDITYDVEIEKIIQNGKQMMQENNEKHKVKKEYSYDDYDFDFRDETVFMFKFREKFIGDEEFRQKYEIGKHL